MALATDAQPVSENFRLESIDDEATAPTENDAIDSATTTASNQSAQPVAVSNYKPTFAAAADGPVATTRATIITREREPPDEMVDTTPLYINNNSIHERRRPPSPHAMEENQAAMEENQAAMEESVLRDVQEELDRERSRRAELEDSVRKLTEERTRILQED